MEKEKCFTMYHSEETKFAEAAKVFSDLLTECECSWRMDWFQQLGTYHPEDIVDILVNEYCRDNNYYDDEHPSWDMLSKQTRESLADVVASLAEPVYKVFNELHPKAFARLHPGEVSTATPRIQRTSYVAWMLDSIPGCCEKLPQFFTEQEDGTVVLNENL